MRAGFGADSKKSDQWYSGLLARRYELSEYRVLKLMDRIAAYRTECCATDELEHEIDRIKDIALKKRISIEGRVLAKLKAQPEINSRLDALESDLQTASTLLREAEANLARRVLREQNRLEQETCDSLLGKIAWHLWLHPNRHRAHALEPARKSAEEKVAQTRFEKLQTEQAYKAFVHELLDSKAGRAVRQQEESNDREAPDLITRLPGLEKEYSERITRQEEEAIAIWRHRRWQSLEDAVQILVQDDLIQQNARRPPQEVIREAEQSNDKMANELLKAGFTLAEIEELKNG